MKRIDLIFPALFIYIGIFLFSAYSISGWEAVHNLYLLELYTVWPWNPFILKGFAIVLLYSILAFGLILVIRRIIPPLQNIPILDASLILWPSASGLLLSLTRWAVAYEEANWIAIAEPFLIAAVMPLTLTAAGGLLRRLIPVNTGFSRSSPIVGYIILTQLLGAVFWAIALYLIALGGLWSPATLGLLMVVVLLVGLPVAWRGLRQIESPETIEASSWESKVLCGLLLVVLQASFQLSWLPPDDSDELRYHLAIPKRYFEAGGWVDNPDQQFSHFPLAMEMLSALPMGLEFSQPKEDRMGWTSGGKFVHYWFFCLCLMVLLAWSRDLEDRQEDQEKIRGPPWAVWIFATIPFAPVLAAWAFVDFGSTFGWLASAYFAWCLVQHDSSDEGLPGIYRFSILIGVAVGWGLMVKYTGLAWWAILIVVLSIALAARRIRLRTVMAHAVGITVTTFLVASPWLINNVVRTGNPFSPLLSSLFDGGFSPVQKTFYDWHAGLKGDLNLFWTLSPVEKLMDLASLPFQAAVSPERFEHNPIGGLLFGLLPLILVAFYRNRGRVGFILGIILGGYLLWGLSYRDPRFALPVWGFAAVLIGSGFPRGSNILRTILLSLVFSWGLGQCTGLVVRYAKFSDTVFLRQSPDDYLADRLPAFNAMREVEKMRKANGTAPTLLLLGEEQSYYFDSPLRGGDYFDGPWLARVARESSSLEEMTERIGREGVDWIWINRGTLEGNGLNLIRGYFFCLKEEEGADAIEEFVETKPSGLHNSETLRLLGEAEKCAAYRRMHAWLVHHPGFEERPLASVRTGERPICDQYRGWMDWPEMEGVSATDLPRVPITLLVPLTSE